MKRGEIYLVDLGPGIGYEPTGLRPVVVISNDVNNLAPLIVSVLPAVDAADVLAGTGIRVAASESGFTSDIAVLMRQPRTLDASRFTAGPVGSISSELMQKISFELQVHLDLFNAQIPRP